jgi:hypothetical protein
MTVRRAPGTRPPAGAPFTPQDKYLDAADTLTEGKCSEKRT